MNDLYFILWAMSALFSIVIIVFMEDGTFPTYRGFLACLTIFPLINTFVAAILLIQTTYGLVKFLSTHKHL